MLLCGVSSEVLGQVCRGKAAAGAAGGIYQSDFTVVLHLPCQKILAQLTENMPASLRWCCLPDGRWQTDEFQLQGILCIRMRKCFDQAPN